MAETKQVASIPADWGADASGRASTRPSEILAGGGMLPVGGYKGGGLSAMVELLCGGLAGAPMGGAIRSWRESATPANLAQCFIAVDPDCFASGFGDRLQAFLEAQRALRPLDAAAPVLVAGDPERANEARCDAAGGLIYGRNQIEALVSGLMSTSNKMPPLCSSPSRENTHWSRSNFVRCQPKTQQSRKRIVNLTEQHELANTKDEKNKAALIDDAAIGGAG